MNKRIKEAFKQVRAESELKDRTKEYISQKTKGYRRTKTMTLQTPCLCFCMHSVAVSRRLLAVFHTNG